MNSTQQLRPPSQGGIKAHDILYVLFKHKWKIILLSLAGFAIAGALAYRNWLNPSYETRIELLVRYVVERNSGDPDAPSTTSGGTAMAVMDTELEILKSFNVATATVDALGPENVMPPGEKAPTRTEAAAYVVNQLTAEAERGSNIIQLSYRDTDPQRAVKVLTQIKDSYFKRHLEIHRSTTAFNEVSIQADQARSALRSTEDEINKLKAESGVLSIKGTIEEFESRRQLVRTSLMAAQASLAEQRAKVAALEGSSDSAAPDLEKSEATETAPDATPVETPEQRTARRKTAEALAEYTDLSGRLEMLRDERNRGLTRRPSSDPTIRAMDRQIAEVQTRKLDLGVKYPEFAGRIAATTGMGMQIGPVRTIEDERALLTAFEARVAATILQAEEIEKEVEDISALSFKLEELEGRRQMEEDKYRYYQTSLDRARVDETLDPSKMPNFGVVQDPSPPVKSIDGKTMKLILGIAGSGVMLGLGFAFFMEWVVDRRISRPNDIKTRLQLPLMLSIPFIRSKDDLSQLIGSTDPLEPPPVPGSQLAMRNGNEKLNHRSEPAHFIAPFAAAIHDRILFNFEINNITHKPKLVAMTGLSEGAGTSTIATGVAKAFSEGGNRKVLLVDLNPPRDRETSGPATESLRIALETSRSEQFRKTPQNLYFASAATRRFQGDTTALAPVGLRDILPYLVASDFDYIIFDMPPVDPTSPTVAMAGFMDKVLLVLDADKTTPDNLKWAYSELEKGRADVSCIFNKVRSHAPRWVEGSM